VQRSALDEIERLDRTVAGVPRIVWSGRIVLEPVDLRIPVGAAVHAVQALLAEASGTALEPEFPDARVQVPGDPNALQQLFTNLSEVGKGTVVEVVLVRAEGA